MAKFGLVWKDRRTCHFFLPQILLWVFLVRFFWLPLSLDFILLSLLICFFLSYEIFLVSIKRNHSTIYSHGKIFGCFVTKTLQSHSTLAYKNSVSQCKLTNKIWYNWPTKLRYNWRTKLKYNWRTSLKFLFNNDEERIYTDLIYNNWTKVIKIDFYGLDFVCNHELYKPRSEWLLWCFEFF